MRWLLLALVACAHPAGGSGGFRVFYPDAGTALMHQSFQVHPSAECKYDNGHDARWTAGGWTVESGQLPPGLTLEDGAITGKPSATGNFTARIKLTNVTCAGKPVADQHVDVTISVL